MKCDKLCDREEQGVQGRQRGEGPTHSKKISTENSTNAHNSLTTYYVPDIVVSA